MILCISLPSWTPEAFFCKLSEARGPEGPFQDETPTQNINK